MGPKADYRDAVIDTLQMMLAEKDAALIEALRDRETYREMAKEGIEQLRKVTLENGRLKAMNADFRAQIQSLICDDDSDEQVAA